MVWTPDASKEKTFERVSKARGVQEVAGLILSLESHSTSAQSRQLLIWSSEPGRFECVIPKQRTAEA